MVATSTLVRQEHFKALPSTDVDLATVTRRRQNPKWPKNYRQLISLRYRWLNEPQLHALKSDEKGIKPEKTEDNQIIEGADLIINIMVHRPFDVNMQYGFKNLIQDKEYQVSKN